MKKYFSEFLGTSILVLFGCGTAAIAGSYVGALGIALAFGLSIIVGSTIIGSISGCHVNPAISLAMFLTKRMNLKDFIGYIIAQIIGAMFGIFLLSWIITSANIGSIESVGLGANGFKELSSVGLSMRGAFLVEVILTFIFVLTVLEVTKDENKKDINIIIIALALTAVHIIGIPLTGTSVNPARSFAPAIFLGGQALKQVWVFIIAPLCGAVLAAALSKFVLNKN